MSDSRKKNQYFVPGEGIAREIISADICKYLDNDATVRPGEYQGRPGYFIYAYRNLTTEMIRDLKEDSAAYEREMRDKPKRAQPKDRGDNSSGRASKMARSGDPVTAYMASKTYQDRNEYGYAAARNSSDDVPSSSAAPPAFGLGRGAPSMEYSRPPGGPYSDPAYTHSPGSGYPPSSQPQPYPYEPGADRRGPLLGAAPHEYSGPESPGGGYHPQSSAPYIDPRDPRNPRSSYAVHAATAPPAAHRYPAPMDSGRYGPDAPRYPPADPHYGYSGEGHQDMRGDMEIDPRPVDVKHDPRTGSRSDLHMDTRMDPRMDPREDPRYAGRPDPRMDPRADQRQYADARGEQQYYGDNRRRRHQ